MNGNEGGERRKQMAGQTYRTRASARDCRSNAVSFEDSRAQVECEVGGGCCHQTVTAFPAQRQMMRQICLTTVRTLAAVAVLLLSSCADWVQGKIPMDSDVQYGNLQDMLIPPAEEVKTLGVPKQLLASEGAYSGIIYLRWSYVPNATSYSIEYAVKAKGDELSPDDEFLPLTEYTKDVVYKHVILNNPQAQSPEYGNCYYYRVKAENIADKLEYEDEDNPYSPVARGYLMPAPQAVSAWQGDSIDEVQVSWEPVEGAQYYELSRTYSRKGTMYYDKVYSNETTYSDAITSKERGTEFYYKVRAQQSNGEYSAYSLPAMGYALAEGAPPSVENVRIVNALGVSKTQLVIEWDAVEPPNEAEYEDGQVPTRSYKLFRNGQNIASLPLSNVSFIDKEVSVNELYSYTVQVEDKYPDKSTKASKASAPSNEGFLLSPPTELTIADGENGTIRLGWRQALGTGMDGVSFTYNIYASDYQAGPWTKIKVNVSGEWENGYLYESVPENPFFIVTTYNEAAEGDKESIYSSSKSPSPSAPKNVRASKTEKFDGSLFVPNDNGVYPVRITWEAPDDDNKPSGYNVYRATSKTASGTKLNSTPIRIAGDDGTFEYIDKYDAAKIGTFYYYRVVSLGVDGTGNKSNDPANDPNNDARGYGALTAEKWFREYNKDIKSSQKKIGKMNVSNDTDKIGTDAAIGEISGRVDYETSAKNILQAASGLTIYLRYKDYADYPMPDDKTKGYFVLNGNAVTKITSVTSQSGSMTDTVNVTGMYPGSVNYDGIVIKGGGAAGGFYAVTTKDYKGENSIFINEQIDWTIGEE